jgi:hypothetical protein
LLWCSDCSITIAAAVALAAVATAAAKVATAEVTVAALWCADLLKGRVVALKPRAAWCW